MDPKHKAAIQNQYPSLVAQTDLNVMLSSLYEKGVFAEHMIEQYKNPHTSDTNHKRKLYLHLMRRGPNAFRHLIDTLWENGLWGLARELDPEGEFHGRPRPAPERSSNNDESSFISISSKKKEKAKSEAKKVTSSPPPVPPPSVPPPPVEPVSNDPPFVVKKCTEPIIDTSNDIKMYPVARRRRQRVMLLYTYMHFEHDIEHTRRGADRDSENLKLLFHELGFTFASYFDHNKEETMASLRSLSSTLAGALCVFVVVSSHGYDRLGSADNYFRCSDGQLISLHDFVDHFSADNYFRCSDGQLISLHDFVDHFSNKALPELRGVPKVFIFQTCRGNKDQDDHFAPKHVRPPRDYSSDGVSYSEGSDDGNSNVADVGSKPDDGSGTPEDCAAGVSHDGLAKPERSSDHDGPQTSSRIFSDILIAHSTVPGYVSNRNPEQGSWYIQTLCQVFAAHAHHLHVEELLTLVDQRMEDKYHRQTSSVDKWGFNCRLYLMPGLQE